MAEMEFAFALIVDLFLLAAALVFGFAGDRCARDGALSSNEDETLIGIPPIGLPCSPGSEACPSCTPASTGARIMTSQ